MNTSTPTFTGLIPPMITPLSATDQLDVEGLERLIERLVNGGVHGIFILGTTGEGPCHSYSLRKELVRQTTRFVAGRLPVLVGITDTSFSGSLEIARDAAGQGAAALVASAPYYLPPSQPELAEYFDHLVPRLPLPLLLYNMPSMTKVSFAVETVERLMQHEGIAGIKDSGGDMIHFHKLLRLARQRADWSTLIGPEALLLEALEAGAHGGVSSGAMIDPWRFVGLYNAFQAGDLVKAREFQEQIHDLGFTLCRVGRHPSANIKGIKCALSVLGVCNDFMAEPLHRFRDKERREIEQHLERLGIRA